MHVKPVFTPFVPYQERKEGKASWTAMSHIERHLPTKTLSSSADVPARGPLGVRDFGSRGRGVVALEDIQSGRLVERSPVLIVPPEDRHVVDQTVIFSYVFMWEPGSVEQDLYEHKGRSAIALGYTSLLSHSYSPNCNFVRHVDALFIDVFANRLIRAGEELTIDYQMTLWFEPEIIA